MRAANPFFTSREGANIGNNIGLALFGDPQKSGAHALQQAKRRLADQEFGGKESLAGLFSSFTPGSDMSPEFAAQAVRGGVRGNDLANLFLTVAANNSGVGDARVARALAGTGKTLGKDDAVSISGQSRIRADNERVGDERQASVNATSRANNADTIQGAMERLQYDIANRAVNTPAGGTTTFGPDAGRDTVRGADTLSTAKAGILQDANAGGEVTDLARELFLGSSATTKPPVFGAKDINSLDTEIARSLGAVDTDGNVMAGFDQAVGTERLNAARQAAGKVFQETRDFSQALAAAIQSLNLGEGARFDSGEGFLFDSEPSISGGNPATSATIEPAPALQAREVGKVYQTPKGAYRWTGAGWEPAT